MKAIKCQLKMKCDMPGQTIQGLLEYVYSQPIIAGHPKQVSVRKSFHKILPFWIRLAPSHGIFSLNTTDKTLMIEMPQTYMLVMWLGFYKSGNTLCIWGVK